ncbi:MAG TPA: S8 family serine peptidase [Candidatus Binatia bacterium]|nr:S8 family serine peptidase [Candidatus Binatia bacterium]
MIRFRWIADSLSTAVLIVAALSLLAPAPAVAQSWLWEIPVGLEPGFHQPGYVPGELLVQFKGSVTAAQRQAAAASEGAQLASDVTPDGLVKIRLAPGQTVDDMLDHWNARADVDYAAPNLYARGFFTPNDTTIAHFDLAWNLRAVHAYDAWDVVTGHPDVVLAIIDTGVAYEDHEIPEYERPFVKPGVTMYRRSPELPGPFLPGWDFVHEDAHPNDDNGHGTFITTIAAGAANNTAGSAGIAFGVTILPIKVIDYRNDSDMEWIIKGIRLAADQGADIANLSLGFPPVRLFRALGYRESFLAHMFNPLQDAVTYAQRRGTILVAATGNFGAPEVSLPAGYPGVIAVGATGPDDTRAAYSSYGPDVDFMAPGGDFGDVNGDHVQDGIFVLSIKPYRSAGSLANPDSFDVFVQFGTSNAAPHVSGAVALLRSLGLRDQGAIEQTLRATAVNRFQTTRAFDPLYGNGLIQLDQAVRHPVGPTGLAAAIDGGPLAARIASGNPARGAASIAFTTRTSGPVRVQVFDARGALVRTIEQRISEPGTHALTWDGRGQGGSPAASGVYWMRLSTPEGSAVRKVAFLR